MAATGKHFTGNKVIDVVPSGKNGELPEFVNRTGNSTEGMKTFLKGGDQGWVSVKLESAQDVSHNTKLLRFALPEPDMASGVFTASAILTKFQPEGAKPVIRPYTPVSANSESHFYSAKSLK